MILSGLEWFHRLARRLALPALFGFLLVALTPVFAQKQPSDGYSLDRTVYFSKGKASVYALLGEITEQTGLLFIYDSNAVSNDKEVKIKKGRRSVREAIREIVGGDDLDIQLINQHILIRRSLKTTQTRRQKVAVRDSSLTIFGRLLDKHTGEAIPNATVAIRRQSVGVVTNQEGFFKLSLSDSLRKERLYFSHIGYIGQEIEASWLMGKNSVVSLEPKVIPLQEVVIRMVNPHKLLREMLEAKDKNYAQKPTYFTTFYREGVQFKNRLQSLTEGVFKIYKAPTDGGYASDQVKLLKMKRMLNKDSRDSLLAKIGAGIDACLQLDLMKNLPEFFDQSVMSDYYTYSSGGVAFWDNRWVNVIHFKPRESITYPLYCGELYIDSETNALVEAHIEINPKYVKKMTNALVHGQAKYYKFIAHKVYYTLSYKPYNGVYYLYHVRGDLVFKTRRRKLFSAYSTLHTWFEMVNCRVETEKVEHFKRVERIPLKTVLSEVEFNYDADFWKDFNVIPLESEWAKLIDSVNMRIEKTIE